MELVFSLKKAKEEKVEKYPEMPVLTFLGGENVSKFELNKCATKALGFTEGGKISFGLADGDKLFLANTSTVETGNQCRVNLDNTFNNKKFLDGLHSYFEGIKVSKGDEFLLNIPEKETEFKIVFVTDINPDAVDLELETQVCINEEPEEDFETSNSVL